MHVVLKHNTQCTPELYFAYVGVLAAAVALVDGC